MNKNAKIFVTGHKGLVGSAVIRRLKKLGFKNILTVSKKKLDLRDQKKVNLFLNKYQPNSLIIAAAKVGGIKTNNELTGEFIYDNLQIQNNLIHGAYKYGIKNLIYLGSSCIYPKFSKQPIKEDYLLTGELEKTNEAYAVAKIAGVKMCEYYNKQYNTNYKSLMPCNTFGSNDNYDLLSSHFIPALIRKIFEAKIKKKKSIELWGNGKTKRELIFVDDLADAIIFFLFKKTKKNLINIGTQVEFTIEEYAKLIMKKLNVNLSIKYKKKSLVGTPRKIMDSSLAKKLGWKSKIKIEEGIDFCLRDFKENYKKYCD
ncbi:GDP-L-fucose synthase [Candidatus Pelagibacter giovannonii]|uniref:GDP-L-fucose synthase n=1 Tax=Candidatus Pelagibacter giovannonii TaxID=2563896 RepID=A0A6H1Q265_9PROT|nr:GDP-L-fucose synthase [Candidatus Pelagibacter giovannonii]QIZ20796.1 GDP-L-fucose synthase [Candidatus Pelagibacter giovannonii]